MKNIIIIILLLVGIFYFFVPYNTQVFFLDKIGIDSSFLSEPEIVKNIEGGVVSLKFDSEHKVTYWGSLSDGKIMTDLSWASGNFVKCFDKDKYDKFSGNLLMHKVLLGKNKSVTIKLYGEGSENLSMFVYKTDALSKVYPPEKEYTHDCKINAISGLSKEIEMNGNTITSDIVIGVAGSKGVLKGAYTLEIIEK